MVQGKGCGAAAIAARQAASVIRLVPKALAAACATRPFRPRVENQIKPAIRRLIKPDFSATFPPPQRWLTQG